MDLNHSALQIEIRGKFQSNICYSQRHKHLFKYTETVHNGCISNLENGAL